ncbi:MAG: hypothetical protein KDA27_13000 [Candidatus Eisenbacteria bacterium]|uniref:Uncharacterized protein n=1 Tax=Eiseniibacteriota bacterium TaxID=2212470 RepID=A0A956NCI3_UNCEI|nr:hypothetical protein [Candidatus Eisenbacteria bacterium]MCB9465864.1 hypothetical protein [Candidatus Eisenbacteria bacterium]
MTSERELTKLWIRYCETGEAEARDRALAELYPWGLTQVTKLARANDCDMTEAHSVFGERLASGLDSYAPEKGLLFGFVYSIARNAVRESYSKRRRDRKAIVLESQMGTEDDDTPAYHERVPAPDSNEVEAATLQRQAFLFIIAIIGGYPHQQIAFGLTTYVVPAANAAQLVEQQYGPGLLPQLLAEVADELRTAEWVPDDVVEFYSDVIRSRMATVGSALFGKDYPHLASRPVLDTQLVEYFGKDGGAKSIADWNNKLRDRVRRCFLDPEKALRTTRLPSALEHSEVLYRAVGDLRA